MYGESLPLTFPSSPLNAWGKEFWRVNLKIFYIPFAVYEIPNVWGKHTFNLPSLSIK